MIVVSRYPDTPHRAGPERTLRADVPLARRAAAFLALYCALLSPPTPAAPRTVVEQVATLIENNYFDAAQARSIAKDLRDANQTGASTH
jgi:hypothetical protein